MKNLVSAILTLGLALSLSGCSQEPQAAYDTVEELKAAYEEVSKECIDWEQTNAVRGSAQSGTCGLDTVLSVYLSPEATERQIESTKASIFGISGNDWLVGENWIINTPDVEELQEDIGGRIVSFAEAD